MKNRFLFLFCIITPLIFFSACEPDVPGSTLHVYYYENGADSGSAPIDTALYSEGQSITILGNINSLTKSGYVFECWTTLFDGSGDSYTTGDKVIIGTEDLNLYACFIDNTAPVPPEVSVALSINNSTPTWSWTAASDVESIRYQLNSTFGSWITVSSSVSEFSPNPSLADGTHELYVQCADAAGNWSNSGSASITIDTAISFTGYLTDDTDGVDGLNRGRNAVVSPDGKNVYVASELDNSVAAFIRDTTTGLLTYIQILKDGSGGVDGLSAAMDIAISNDGKSIYVTGRADDAVAVFARDLTTGSLSFIEMHKDGVEGVDGLNDPWGGICISPDDEFLYVTGASDNAIAVFSRNTTTGALSFIEKIADGAAGVTNFSFPQDVIISPDGQFLFAAAQSSDAVAVFSRNTISGELTYNMSVADGTGSIDGLDGASELAISGNGTNLYVHGRLENAIAVFTINQSDGSLTFMEFHKSGIDGVSGIGTGYQIIVSPDDKDLLAVSFSESALAVFSRELTTGALLFKTVFKDNISGVDGLDGAVGLAISPDGTSVYTTSVNENSLAIFDR